jgi:hypothetical protein
MIRVTTSAKTLEGKDSIIKEVNIGNCDFYYITDLKDIKTATEGLAPGEYVMAEIGFPFDVITNELSEKFSNEFLESVVRSQYNYSTSLPLRITKIFKIVVD